VHRVTFIAEAQPVVQGHHDPAEVTEADPGRATTC
jgi:hypothetical protein